MTHLPRLLPALVYSELPEDHADITEVPQVNFTSICNSAPLRASKLPSTVQILDFELDKPTTDDGRELQQGCLFTLQAGCFDTLLAGWSFVCIGRSEGDADEAQCAQGWATNKCLQTKTWGDFLAPLLLGARALPKPPSDFPKLYLRFVCWLLLDLLVLQLNLTCLYS